MRTDIDFLVDLEEDLRTAAEGLAGGGAGPRARRGRTSRRPRFSRRIRWGIAVAATLVLAAGLGSTFLAANGGLFGGREAEPASRRAAGRLTSPDTGQPAPIPAGVPSTANGYTSWNAPVFDEDGSTAGQDVPIVGPRVVKTASLGIVVPRDGFQAAYAEAGIVATRYGGYVESSRTSGSDSRRGEMVIRVPVERFEAAVADLQDLGKLEAQNTAGEDVTARYVDLHARLRAWQAEEEALVALLSKATTVDSALRVRRELQTVRTQIERLQGQIRVLDDATDLATIAVSIREQGVAIEQAKSDGPSLSEAWQTTKDTFLGVVFAMMIGLAFMVPIIVVLVLGWLVLRRARRPKPRSAD